MMYTITRGPSKLVTQRRTGPTQQLDSKISDFKHKQTSWNMPGLPAPKIVFNRLNGKKYHHAAPAAPAHSHHGDGFTLAHEENVKFISEAWQEVLQQEQEVLQQEPEVLQQEQEVLQQEPEVAQVSEPAEKAVHYKEATPSSHMHDFVPLDLDEWWAQRFLANIDKLS